MTKKKGRKRVRSPPVEEEVREGCSSPPISSDYKILWKGTTAMEDLILRDRRIVDASWDGTMPSVLAGEAERDIGERQERLEQDLQSFRDLLKQETQLRAKLDKPFLLAFLRARKFDLQASFKMMTDYYKVLKSNADVYENLVPDAVDHVWDMKFQTVMPLPDEEDAWWPQLCSLDDLFRSQVLVLEHLLRSPITQLFGLVAVVDCKGLAMRHAMSLGRKDIRRIISIVQEVFPLRFKALYFVNEPFIFDWIFNLVKPFLAERLKKRIHFLRDDLASLHAKVARSNLPQELGGTLPPLENNILVEDLKRNTDYFLDHFNYGYTN